MRISDWSSDVCSSDLSKETPPSPAGSLRLRTKSNAVLPLLPSARPTLATVSTGWPPPAHTFGAEALLRGFGVPDVKSAPLTLVSVQPPPLRSAAVVLLSPGAASEPSERSEEHTSELQSLMRISY